MKNVLICILVSFLFCLLCGCATSRKPEVTNAEVLNAVTQVLSNKETQEAIRWSLEKDEREFKNFLVLSINQGKTYKTITVGTKKEDVLRKLGEPEKITKDIKGHDEQWEYLSKYLLYFDSNVFVDYKILDENMEDFMKKISKEIFKQSENDKER